MKGFSPRNLKYMRAFGEAWPEEPSRRDAMQTVKLSFKAFQPGSGENRLPANAVESIYVSRDGTAWVSFESAGLARIKGDHVTLYDAVEGKKLKSLRDLRPEEELAHAGGYVPTSILDMKERGRERTPRRLSL
jgi:hypothetical protein